MTRSPPPNWNRSLSGRDASSVEEIAAAEPHLLRGGGPDDADGFLEALEERRHHFAEDPGHGDDRRGETEEDGNQVHGDAEGGSPGESGDQRLRCVYDYGTQDVPCP